MPCLSVVGDAFVHAHPDHPIDVVLDRLSESGGVLPVVSRIHARRVEGVITHDSLLNRRCSTSRRNRRVSHVVELLCDLGEHPPRGADI